MSAVFAPRKPRHIVLRAMFGILGLAMLTILLFFGLLIGTAMLAATLLYKLVSSVRNRAPVHSAGNIVEGEYRVVREKPALPLSR
ncbi:MAG: hypothetical protein LBV45_05600 [Xanthomonadaceae bacterium]|nr:hypothetical protein [Xanthomonadaceae bacterium]